MRRFLASNALLLLLIVTGIAILVSLGSWQVRRLGEKEALIAHVTSRMSAAARPLADIEALWAAKGDVDYYPVTLSGSFDHTRESYFYNSWNGMSGWHVITPLKLADGREILVNRGFVPNELRDPALRKDGEIQGVVSMTALARNPVSQKPNSLIPDNRPDKREYYWKDFAALAKGAGLGGSANLIPFMVDAGANVNNQPTAWQWPKGGVTMVSFPNNHLQYAVTWYGLALTLFGVGFWFIWTRYKQK